MRVSVYQTRLRGASTWVMAWTEGGKCHRRYFKTKTVAEAEAVHKRSELDDNGATWASLTTIQRQRLIMAWREAEERGLDLYALATGAPAKAREGEGVMLAKAVDDLVEAKEKAGRSGDYVDGLRIVLGHFLKGREADTVDEVQVGDVEAFLDTKRQASHATLRARLSTLFRFCVRRGWRSDNPCDRLEVVTLPHQPPAVLTVAQTESALAWMQASAPHALPWFILSTFAGLRPEEAEKTRREDIHEAEGWIKVEAQTSKVRQRRVVYPLPCVMKLLAGSLAGGRLPIPSITRRRALRGLREHLGMSVWPKDLTRHTAASYWLAHCQSAAQVAESLGHSELVLRRNYKAMVTAEEAKAFFALCDRLLPLAKPKPADAGAGDDHHYSDRKKRRRDQADAHNDQQPG